MRHPSRRNSRRKAVYLMHLLFIIAPQLSSTMASESKQRKECGIYLAPSTIPGAGMGMFAGNKLYREGEMVTFGDIVVPVFELDWHNGHEDYDFLWNEYVWSFAQFWGMDQEVDEGSMIHVVSSGMGAAVNCMLPLVNVVDNEDEFSVSSSGVSSQSPGAGAFTPYHSRRFEATEDILPGSELFASYGEDYFASRADRYGYIPLLDNYKRADKFLRQFNRLSKTLSRRITEDEMHDEARRRQYYSSPLQPSPLSDDIWNFILEQREVWTESRTLNAIPSNYTEIQNLLKHGGTARQHYNASILDLEYLEEHGQCMDNIIDGVSTIPDAGRGAFATRKISKGDIVAPAPLIHIPNRTILTMYSMHEQLNEEDHVVRNVSDPIHQQLLLNYCFGHKESLLLLCPYGLLTSLINHSKENANVEIVWSKSMRHIEWRDMPIEEWGSTMHNGLSFDFVALRDIQEGEEILLSYGDEWDEAWKEHVRTFETPRESYVPAYDLNEMDDLVIRTVNEKPYEADGLHLYCRNTYVSQNGIEVEDEIHDFDPTDEPLLPCRALHRMSDDSYVAEVFSRDYIETDDGEEIGLERIDYYLMDVPRDAFYFKDVSYERSHHKTWSFRHDMRIPDSMFPPIWKNNVSKEHSKNWVGQ